MVNACSGYGRAVREHVARVVRSDETGGAGENSAITSCRTKSAVATAAYRPDADSRRSRWKDGRRDPVGAIQIVHATPNS